MTLTYPALARARQILWLVTGEDKQEPLAKLLAGDTTIPAGRVEAAASLVIWPTARRHRRPHELKPDQTAGPDHGGNMAPPIRLFLADVDGTLVTQDKVLTDRAIAAVAKLRQAGILFAITSGRPPRGMSMLIEPLEINTPIAAFNGGLFVQSRHVGDRATVMPDDVTPK